jgi:hypothetical protein
MPTRWSFVIEFIIPKPVITWVYKPEVANTV